MGQPTAVLLNDPILPTDHRSPSAGAGIAPACAVGPDQHLARRDLWEMAGQRPGSATRTDGHWVAVNHEARPS
jgi:hypothetical protein